MIATGIIILLSSICTWFVTRRALTPLRRFSDRIRQVQAQNLSEPLEVPLSEDEISRLTRSFNDMLARLDNAFSAQKQFVASAAHELRTPLAVMQTNLEVFTKTGTRTPGIRQTFHHASGTDRTAFPSCGNPAGHDRSSNSRAF